MYKTKCTECKKHLPDYDEMNNRVINEKWNVFGEKKAYQIVCEDCAEEYIKEHSPTWFSFNKDDKPKVKDLKSIKKVKPAKNLNLKDVSCA